MRMSMGLGKMSLEVAEGEGMFAVSRVNLPPALGFLGG